ncbi:L30e-like protein [Zopfochytrium polystomum]|nr:L30e-like protein [Zopfochytrium polystomum]
MTDAAAEKAAKKKAKKAAAAAAATAGAEEAMQVDASPAKSKPTVDYEERVKSVSAIAHPLAGKKLTKRLTRSSRKLRTLKRGVKEVVKGLRKGSKGIVLLAGDISPIDVLTHLPVLCEEANVPYVYVPSKEDLGAAASTKRPTSCIMLVRGGKPNGKKAPAASEEDVAEFEGLYAEVEKEVLAANEKLIVTV